MQLDFEYQGYVRQRGFKSFEDKRALLTGVVASQEDMHLTLEANLQPHLRVGNGVLGVAGDVSGVLSTQGALARLLVNEAYVEAHLFDRVYVLAGRRRVTWGTGLSWNPTDLINPARDPLEPAQTRAGSLLLPMIDVVLPAVTLSALMSTPVTYNDYGLPTAAAFDKPVFGARALTHLFGADLSLMYFRETQKNWHAVGLATSVVLADFYEIHAEALAHTGKADRPAMQNVDACGPALTDGPAFGGSAVVGARRDWSDQSLVAFEYLYNSAGLDPSEYHLVRSELPCLRAAATVAALTQSSSFQPVASPVVMLRQHYLSLLAQRPHLAEGWLENFGVSAGALVSLSDASTIIQARVEYVAFGRLSTALSGAVWLDPGGGEMSLAPARGLVSVDLRYAY